MINDCKIKNYNDKLAQCGMYHATFSIKCVSFVSNVSNVVSNVSHYMPLCNVSNYNILGNE